MIVFYRAEYDEIVIPTEQKPALQLCDDSQNRGDSNCECQNTDGDV